MNETWLPVVGFEGRYEVSDLGRVRSLDRKVLNNGTPVVIKGVVLRPSADSKGRLQVRPMREGRGALTFVHRIVLEAFVGPCPEGMVCCHWDDDPTNNALANLRWDTQSENMRDQARNGRHRYAGRTHCKRGHELTDENTYSQGVSDRSCRLCRGIHSRNRGQGGKDVSAQTSTGGRLV